MKSEIIQNAIGDIDDELIEAADVKNGKMKNNIIKWTSVAAAACLVIVCAFAVAPMLKNNNPVKPDTQPQNGKEAIGDPNYSGDEIGMHEQYKYAVDFGEFVTYEMGRVIPSGKIGEKISDVTVTAGWVRQEGWLKNEHANAEIYEINGVSKETAVAIKFLDKLEAETTEQYYVIVNPAADKTPVRNYVIEIESNENLNGEE